MCQNGLHWGRQRPKEASVRNSEGRCWEARAFATKMGRQVGFFYPFFIHQFSTTYSSSAGIVDSDNRVVAILAGRPADKDWPLLQSQAAEALEKSRMKCDLPKGKGHHRRGKFVTLNCGISYGGGQRVPGNLHNEPANDAILSELNSLPVFKRLAKFSSCTYLAFMHARF